MAHAGRDEGLRDGRALIVSTQTHQVIDRETNESREIVRYGTSAEKILDESEKKLPHNRRAEAREARSHSLPVLPDDPRRLPESLYPRRRTRASRPTPAPAERRTTRLTPPGEW